VGDWKVCVSRARDVGGIYRRNDPGLYRNGDLVGDKGVIRQSCILASIAPSEGLPMRARGGKSRQGPVHQDTVSHPGCRLCH